MDQSTTPKPVMDVTPPASKDTGPATHGVPSSADAANTSPTGSLPTASPATQPAESELVGESTKAEQNKDPLAVHQAPPLSDEDKTSPASGVDAASQPEQKPTAHTAAPKPHGPAAAITTIILGMLLLSALAILVYLNS